MTDRVSIIDLDPVIHIVAHAQFTAGNKSNARVVTQHVDTMINTIKTTCSSSETIMFFQNKGHINFRNSILPEYKGHRVVQEALTIWKGVICDHLISLGAYPLMEIESDDALCIYAKMLRDKGAQYLIVENDKDLAVIPGAHYNPYKKGMAERFYSFSDRESALSLMVQTLTGDSTDMPNSLCGIEGVGTKTAIKYLQDLDPKLHPMKVLMKYIEKYGVTGGLNRMTVTHNLVNLLDTPTESIPETLKIINLTTTKTVDPLAGLFL